eukprot:6210728-Pleurochrysis_carterae.AAC.1
MGMNDVQRGRATTAVCGMRKNGLQGALLAKAWFVPGDVLGWQRSEHLQAEARAQPLTAPHQPRPMRNSLIITGTMCR